MPKQIWTKFKNTFRLEAEVKEPHEPLHVVTAALMIHVSITHDDISDVEKQGVLICIQEHFDLEETQAHKVFEKAVEHHDNATDLYDFTRVIMAELEHEQQIEIVRLLYRVAFADNHLENFEDHIITRIAGLLGVGTRDRVRLKQEVRVETGA